MKKLMKESKRLLVFVIIVSLLFSNFPSSMISASSESYEEYEDFESDMIVVNGAYNGQKLLQKNNTTQWIFEKETTNAAFNLSNYPTNFIQTGDDVNQSRFLSTGTTTMVDGKKSRIIRNLPQTYKNGVVTQEIRLKKPANGVLRFYLGDNRFSGYNMENAGKKLAAIAIRANDGSLTYTDEYSTTTTKTNTKAQITLTDAAPWVYVRMIIDLPKKTMKLYCGTELTNMLPWNGDDSKTYHFMANGSTPYTMADGSLASLFFACDTLSEAPQVACDDVKTFYGSGISPVATGLSITDDNVVGHTLEGYYSTFFDPRGYEESGSTAIWRRADDAAFLTNTEVILTEPVSRNTLSRYTLTQADLGKYIQFSVIPRSAAQDFNEGYESSVALSKPVRLPVTVPSVTMDLPHTDIRVFQGDPITLSAIATCDDTVITHIEYYANDVLIAQSQEGSFASLWNGATQGTYAVYAKAYNALGETGVSQPVIIEVIAKAQPADEFDLLRERWKVQLTGGTNYHVMDADIRARILQIDQEALQGRAYIKNNASYSTNTDSFSKVEAMALAYATTGSSLQGNIAFRDEIIEAFTALNTNLYNDTVSSGFFWGWEFGYPKSICNTIALMYEDIPQDLVQKYMAAIDHHNPSVGYTAANQMWDCQAIMLRGIVGKSSERIFHARDGMKQVYTYVTKGDGFYQDGSFIQHSNIAYNGGYGKSLLREMMEMIGVLEGSSMEITDPAMQNIYEIAYDAYVPFIYKGEMMDMVRGREIGSPVLRNSHRIGHQAMQGIIRMIQFAPEPYQTNFKRIIKKWIIEDTYASFFQTDLPMDIIRLAKDIMADEAILPADELILHQRSANMARVVHLRPGYGFGISMSSNKVGAYEANDGNGNAWYTGAGMTYLYNHDLGQFADYFWTTVNRYRLPGTTVDTVSRANSEGNAAVNPYNWVGGTDIEGLYGVSGMHLGQYNTSLQAKKSWFMFDDEIICLGAGIYSTDGRTIETIIENRKMNDNGSNQLSIDGNLQPTTPGWSTTTDGANWMHLEGNVENSDIGYYFPDAQSIHLLRENRAGSNYGMYEIPGDYNYKTPKNYITMWFDHGKNPTDAKYSYVLLPNKSSRQVQDYANSPDFEIIENSSNIQAIKEKNLQIVAANFWNDGINTADIITADKKASVMTRIKGGVLEVSVSDPTMANKGVINLEINKNALRTISADNRISVQQLDSKIKLQVNVNGAYGKSFTAKFQLAQEPEKVVVINAYYHIPTNTMVDVMICDSVSEPYTPPVKEHPEEYEVKQFIWKDFMSIQPVVTDK